MKCPKCKTDKKVIGVMGIQKGDNAPSYAHEYTLDCSHIVVAPSIPFWDAVIKETVKGTHHGSH